MRLTARGARVVEGKWRWKLEPVMQGVRAHPPGQTLFLGARGKVAMAVGVQPKRNALGNTSPSGSVTDPTKRVLSSAISRRRTSRPSCRVGCRRPLPLVLRPSQPSCGKWKSATRLQADAALDSR
jgi:hypothetical protein